MKISTLSLTFLLTVASLPGATYFVRTDGDNSSEGTANAPGKAFLTVQKAIDVAMAGDSILISPGVYPERVTTKRGGTNGNPILVKNHGSTPILGGFTTGHPYITVEGLSFNGTGVPGYSGLFEVGNGSNGVIVRNCTFDISADLILQLNVRPSVSADGLLIEKCRFLNSFYIAVSLSGSGNYTLRECYFSSPNGGDAIRIFASNVLIKGNRFEKWSNLINNPNHTDLFQTFAYTDSVICKNVRIESNLAIDCVKTQIGNLADNMAKGNIGEWLWINNVFVNVEAAASITTPNTKFINNTFYKCGQNAAHPLMFRGLGRRFDFTGASIVNNTIKVAEKHEFATGSRIAFYDTPSTTLKPGRNNEYYARVIDETTFSIHPSSSDATGGNNVVDISGLISIKTAMSVSLANASGAADNMELYNNLFYLCGQAPTSKTHGWYMAESSGKEWLKNFKSDHSLVFGAGAGTTKSGLVTATRELNALNGIDAGLTQDSLSPRAGNPASNSGKVLTQYTTTDFNGAARDTWSIGAFNVYSAPANVEIQILIE